MSGVSDNEMNVSRKGTGVSGKYGDDPEFSAIIGIEVSTPAIRVMLAVLVRV